MAITEVISSSGSTRRGSKKMKYSDREPLRPPPPPLVDAPRWRVTSVGKGGLRLKFTRIYPEALSSDHLSLSLRLPAGSSSPIVDKNSTTRKEPMDPLILFKDDDCGADHDPMTVLTLGHPSYYCTTTTSSSRKRAREADPTPCINSPSSRVTTGSSPKDVHHVDDHPTTVKSAREDHVFHGDCGDMTALTLGCLNWLQQPPPKRARRKDVEEQLQATHPPTDLQHEYPNPTRTDHSSRQEDGNQLAQPWIFTKPLTASDVGHHLHRLALPVCKASYLLSLWADKEATKRLSRQDHNHKEPIVIRDVDTGTSHNLIFAFWEKNTMYNIQGSWVASFVQRRNLNKGDVIGLRWDADATSLLFGVLSRSAT